MGQTWEMRDFLKLMQILHDSSIISGVFSIFRLYPLSLMSGGYENVNKEYSGNFVLFWFFTSIRFIKYYIILLPFFQLIVVLCWWSDTKWPFLFFILFLLTGEGGGVGVVYPFKNAISHQNHHFWYLLVITEVHMSFKIERLLGNINGVLNV